MRMYRISYSSRVNRKLLPHLQRDGDAFTELADIQYARGFDLGYRVHYGGLFMNYPCRQSGVTYDMDTSNLQAPDLLVLNTRPPLDDEESFRGTYANSSNQQCGYRTRKYVAPSHTTLEHRVLDHLRQYFAICTRAWIRLSPDLTAQLPPGFGNRGDIQFRQHGRPAYKSYRAPDDFERDDQVEGNRTALYLLYSREIWQNGPNLLVAFGMGGVEGLIWSYRLRKEYWHALEIDSTRFVMAEMKMGNIPARPTTLSFADDWPIKVLLNVPL